MGKSQTRALTMRAGVVRAPPRDGTITYPKDVRRFAKKIWILQIKFPHLSPSASFLFSPNG